MKRLIRILLLLPLFYLIAVPVYYARKSALKPVTGIKIIISDSSDCRFVTKREILNVINAAGGKITGTPVGQIRTDEIEKNILRLRELEKADVYISIDGILRVNVEQRDPVMRVMPKNGGDYYIDKYGVVIRRRNLYGPRLHIVGGNIIITRQMSDGKSVLDSGIKNTILKDIYFLVDYIRNDSFWSAQIDQIFVDDYDEIDLIPRVGNHIIHLGPADNFVEKFRNLRVFYDKVLPEAGWNKYSGINLAFSDQIVCKRR